MINIFGAADIAHSYTLADALDDGSIICLSTMPGHENDCRQFYKVPVYITKALYSTHVQAAKKLWPLDTNEHSEAVAKTVGWTIFDMLNMSVTLYHERNEQVRSFKYHLQDTPDTLGDELITNIAVSGPGINGEHIITFMLPEEE